MRVPVITLLFLEVALACAWADESQIDPKLASRASIIIRAQRLRTISGPLQPSDEVMVLAVLKNEPKQKLGDTMRIPRGEFSPPIPDKPSTVYLKRREKPAGWETMPAARLDRFLS